MAGFADFFKGLARGGLADTVGSPVDLAESVVNLSLAGAGYLGNKLGLLSPEQMPNLLKGSIGTSDWFAKGTPLEDPGTPEYTRGRIAAALAPIAHSVAGVIPRTPHGQVNALRLGGDDSLVLSHGTHDILANGGQLPSEVYNLSQAIRKNALSTFGGESGMWLIPRVGQFDPKFDNTVLYNSDFYSPRHSSMAGKRVDSVRNIISPDIPQDDATRAHIIRELASSRLADKFLTQYPRGGFWKEGGMNPLARSLPEFGNPVRRDITPISPQESHQTQVWASPRFQSFKHFEESPYGAGVLGKSGDPSSINDNIRTSTYNLLGNLRNPDGSKFAPYQADHLQALQKFASGQQNPGNPKSAPFTNIDVVLGDSLGRVTPMEFREIQTTARQILAAYKKAPSEYAELKSYGPTPLTPERFAGIVLGGGYDDPDQLSKLAQKRGLPVLQAGSYAKDAEKADLARELQKYAEERKFPVVTRAKAQPIPPAVAEPAPTNFVPSTPTEAELLKSINDTLDGLFPGTTAPTVKFPHLNEDLITSLPQAKSWDYLPVDWVPQLEKQFPSLDLELAYYKNLVTKGSQTDADNYFHQAIAPLLEILSKK